MFIRDHVNKKSQITTDSNIAKVFVGKEFMFAKPTTQMAQKVYEEIYGLSYKDNMAAYHNDPQNWAFYKKSFNTNENKNAHFTIQKK